MVDVYQVMRGCFFAGMLILIISCTSSLPVSSPDRKTAAVAANNVCEISSEGKTSDGENVTICKKLHAEAPYVRPTEDNLTDLNKAQISAGLRFGNPALGAASFIDRSGKEYAWIDSKSSPVNILSLKKQFPNLHLPSHRNLYLVYRVTGKIVNDPIPNNTYFKLGIQVSKIEPEIMILGCAIDSFVLGTWEGEATQHKVVGGPIVFSSSALVPLQIEFDKLVRLSAPLGNLSAWESGAKLAHLSDGQVYAIQGSITNWNQDVNSSESETKFPSLSSYNGDSPFPSQANMLTENVRLYRTAAMHTSIDAVAVFLYPGYDKEAHPDDMPGSGMDGEQLVLTPAAFIQTESSNTDLSKQLKNLSIVTHGPPRGHRMNLHLVRRNLTATTCQQ